MKPRTFRFLAPTFGAVAILATISPHARAAERITLRNGFELDCLHHEPDGDHVRLYLIPSGPTKPEDAGYIEVSSANILRVETIPDPPPLSPASLSLSRTLVDHDGSTAQGPAATDIPQLLAHAGAQHNIDTDLLASIIHAESNGNPHAVSRAGAQGLMQLMPGTASVLGVNNSFAPDQNISGGAAYLDQLLIRYHNDLRLAVAAYNAGPAAVDRYHGIPPYRETRAYVARVVNEFNRRKLAVASHPPIQSSIVAK